MLVGVFDIMYICKYSKHTFSTWRLQRTPCLPNFGWCSARRVTAPSPQREGAVFAPLATSPRFAQEVWEGML